MKSLILYSSVVGNFFASNDHLAAVVEAARATVGDDVWKRGFSGIDPKGATVAAKKALQDAGIAPIKLEGELVHIGFVENRDAAGNSYPKLRVGLHYLDDQYLLSLDLKSDVAQRLVVKLDNCEYGDYIRISAWPTPVERGGRQYINHAASIKDSEGKEIPANSEFSAKVKAQTEAVEQTLKAAGITDKKVVATAKATRRIEAHKELLLSIQARFVEANAQHA